MVDQPHFITFIVDTLQQEKLCIPSGFIRKYGKKLPTNVFLEVPSGKKWGVKLTKSDGRVCLGHGWKEFMEECHIDYGHFLTFRYDMVSSFYVVIYNESCTEIEYPIVFIDTQSCREEKKKRKTQSSKSKLKGPCYANENGGGSENDVSIEILDDFQSSKLLRKRSEPQKKAKAERSYNTSSTHSENVKTSRDCLPTKSRNFVFEIVMTPSKVGLGLRGGYQPLQLPVGFTRDYLNKKEYLIINDSEGRSWRMKLKWYEDKSKFFVYARLTDWKDLAIAKNLKVGDVCVFELIQEDKITLNLTIQPSEEREYSEDDVSVEILDDYSDHGSPKKVEVESSHSLRSCNSDHGRDGIPSFSITMRSAYLKKCFMNIPIRFVNTYIKDWNKKENVVLKTSDESVWSVKFVSHERGYMGKTRVGIGKGWTAFVRQNNLKEGDICKFQLINNATDVIMFKVVISLT